MSLMSDTPRRQLSLIDLSNRPAKGTTKNKPAPTSNNTTLHTPVRPPRTRLFTPLTTQQTLAEQLSFLHLPRPFKTAVYAKNSIRRTKNLQTVLGQEREREHRRIAGEERERDVAMDHDGRGGRGRPDVYALARSDWVTSHPLPRYLDRSTPIAPASSPLLRITGLEMCVARVVSFWSATISKPSGAFGSRSLTWNTLTTAY